VQEIKRRKANLRNHERRLQVTEGYEAKEGVRLNGGAPPPYIGPSENLERRVKENQRSPNVETTRVNSTVATFREKRFPCFEPSRHFPPSWDSSKARRGCCWGKLRWSETVITAKVYCGANCYSKPSLIFRTFSDIICDGQMSLVPMLWEAESQSSQSSI
jgi:hypothetical protein